MTITKEQMNAIMTEVWASMLMMPLEPSEAAVFEDRAPLMIACVQITGGWCGAVSIQSSRVFARLAAASMFALEDDALSDAEVRDALGELVNIVGGNVKGLMPGPSQLSLPMVIEGGRMDVVGAVLEEQFSWNSSGEAIVVSVLVRTPDTAPAVVA